MKLKNWHHLSVVPSCLFRLLLSSVTQHRKRCSSFYRITYLTLTTSASHRQRARALSVHLMVQFALFHRVHKRNEFSRNIREDPKVNVIRQILFTFRHFWFSLSRYFIIVHFILTNIQAFDVNEKVTHQPYLPSFLFFWHHKSFSFWFVIGHLVHL